MILMRKNKYLHFLITGCASNPPLANNIYGEAQIRRRTAAAGAVPCNPLLATGQSKAHENKIYGIQTL